jgi:hypothetical protein
MRETDQFIEITDFSPGIFSDYHIGGGAGVSETGEGAIFAANGAATVDDTERCCADRTGALIPLPKLIVGKTSNLLPTAANAAGNYLADVQANYLLDGYVRADMFIYTEEISADEDRAGVYTMYGFPYDPGNVGTTYWTVIAQLHRLFESTTAQHDLMWARCTASLNSFDASTLQIGAGNFIPFRVRNSVESGLSDDCVAWVAFGSPGWNDLSGVWASGTISATELALTDYDAYTNTTYPGSHKRVLGIFPNPTDNNQTNSGFLGGTHDGPSEETFTRASHLVAHQGRMVATTRGPKRVGQSATTSDTWGVISESITYSPVQDFYGELGFGCFEIAQFGEEKPFRSGVVASITADEIMFIKDREGATMVRGDLDNPTVVQMPYVESTHGAHSIPAKTNFGLVYGTANGVYVWEGGESSRHISQQLEGWFWNHDTTLNYLGNRGKFGWWNPWVVVPNNFLFDSRTQAWWRIDTPANTNVACNVADVSNSSNRLYLFPHKLTGDASPMWYTATPEVLSNTYSWQSQPLIETRSRLVVAHEVHIMATPSSNDAATVTVTLSGYGADGTPATPVVTVFTLAANTNPQMLHKAIATNFQASHMQIKIVADANNASVPAPKVHSVSIATGTRARIAKS